MLRLVSIGLSNHTLNRKTATRLCNLSKKKDPHPYSEETSNLSANSSTAMASNTLKPVFHSKKAYLSYARKHLKIMKSKDTRYLKYFAQQCQEKIANREIAPEKTTMDRDYFVMYDTLRKAALI